eukprot:TRINITY_DN1602_c0_g2_i5.p1 TRINITY_DN1602_c0_g2~~TRINITY_DN1602_c0_g2_i5.p1  ORF type:complete len:685 (+),score=121.74 TRINITY_DN1602_c0_g2_i5:190-2244(+)
MRQIIESALDSTVPPSQFITSNKLLEMLLVGSHLPMPLIWPRSIISVISEHKESITKEVQQAALACWDKVEFNVLKDFLSTLGIRDDIQKEEVVLRIQDLKSKGRWSDVVPLLNIFQLSDDFDLRAIIDSLVAKDRINEAVFLVEANPGFKEYLIEKMSTNVHASKAADLVKRFGLSPENFPTLTLRLKKKCARYLLHNYPLAVVEDYMWTRKEMLGLIAEELDHKGQLDDAVSICKRHALLETGFIKKKDSIDRLSAALAGNTYTYKENILHANDDFVPTETILNGGSASDFINFSTLELEHGRNVFFVDGKDAEAFEKATKELLSSKMVGIDTEFGVSTSTFDQGKIALIQISSPTTTYLFDTVLLAKDPRFCKFIVDLFSNGDILKISHGFSSDSLVLLRTLTIPDMIGRNFCDLMDMYKELDPSQKQPSLAFLCDQPELIGKRLSKGEQMSGWENRPLRKAQIHYAAIDSYVLIELFKMMDKMCLFRGIPLEAYNRDIPLKVKDAKVNEEEKVDGPRRLDRQRADEALPGNRGRFFGINRFEHFYVGKSSNTAFLIDCMLDRLAKYARKRGIDAKSADDKQPHDESLNIAEKENRVIVTRNAKLFENSRGLPCVFLKTDQVEEQFEAIISFFGIKIPAEGCQPRCVKCNGPEIVKIDAEKAKSHLRWENDEDYELSLIHI